MHLGRQLPSLLNLPISAATFSTRPQPVGIGECGPIRPQSATSIFISISQLEFMSVLLSDKKTGPSTLPGYLTASVARSTSFALVFRHSGIAPGLELTTGHSGLQRPDSCLRHRTNPGLRFVRAPNRNLEIPNLLDSSFSRRGRIFNGKECAPTR